MLEEVYDDRSRSIAHGAEDVSVAGEIGNGSRPHMSIDVCEKVERGHGPETIVK